MQSIPNIAADDVSAIMAALPDAASTPAAGFIFDGTTLFLPDAFAAQAQAAYADIAGSRKVLLANYAASVRYAKETAGFTSNGVKYLSDRDTQAKLTAAALMAQINPSATFQWKAETGFVTLTAAQMIAVASAVGSYVQACFAVEGTIDAAIAAGTITTTQQVDGANWPPNA
jgi:hypothetical protein